MAELDLQQFCAKADTRAYLYRPFSVGEFTYATDGRIMVRVAQLPFDPPEVDRNIDWEAPLRGLADAQFAPPPPFSVPQFTPEEIECEDCDGRGKEHDCPSCGCTCESCKGKGTVITTDERSTEFEGAYFGLQYVRLMLALPGVEISKPDGERPWLFRFDGGVGAIMPRRGEKYDAHVKIFREPAEAPQ